MNCPTCGAANPKGRTTCQECGRPLPATAATPPSAAAAPARKTSDMAIASLISGILGWSVLPFVGAVLAVVLGYMARDEIKRSGGTLEGDAMATIGMLLGYANLGLAALAIVAVVLLAVLGIAIPLVLALCGTCAFFGG